MPQHYADIEMSWQDLRSNKGFGAGPQISEPALQLFVYHDGQHIKRCVAIVEAGNM